MPNENLQEYSYSFLVLAKSGNIVLTVRDTKYVFVNLHLHKCNFVNGPHTSYTILEPVGVVQSSCFGWTILPRYIPLVAFDIFNLCSLVTTYPFSALLELLNVAAHELQQNLGFVVILLHDIQLYSVFFLSARAHSLEQNFWGFLLFVRVGLNNRLQWLHVNM